MTGDTFTCKIKKNASERLNSRVLVMTQRWLDDLKMDIHQQLICSATPSKSNHSQHMVPSFSVSFFFPSTRSWQGQRAPLISVFPPMRNGPGVSFCIPKSIVNSSSSEGNITEGRAFARRRPLTPAVGGFCVLGGCALDSDHMCVRRRSAELRRAFATAARRRWNERFTIHEKLPRRFDAFSRQSVRVGGRTYMDLYLQEIQAVADSGAALDYCLHTWKHKSLPDPPPLNKCQRWNAL